MDLSLNEDQVILRNETRRFLKNECPIDFVREMIEDKNGYSLTLWKKMAELGWMGILFGERYGGSGGTFLDLSIISEEMGRVSLPGPFFSTAISSFAILEAGSEEQKQAILPHIAKGNLILSVAWTEPSVTYDESQISTRADLEGHEYVINGTKLFVHDANIANCIIVLAKLKEKATNQEKLGLFLVNSGSPGISRTLLKTIANDNQCEVVLDNVRIPQKDVLGNQSIDKLVLEAILQRAAVAKCAEMLGGAQKVLEMTVSYAKERVQFDHPIGSFQAVQHHCTNMLLDVDTSRAITYQAAWKLSCGVPCARDVAMAKAWVSDAYKRVVELAQKVHGGVGFIIDHDMHFYYRHAQAAAEAFGGSDFYREVVARELGF